MLARLFVSVRVVTARNAFYCAELKLLLQAIGHINADEDAASVISTYSPVKSQLASLAPRYD